MNYSKLNSTKGIFLLLMTAALLFSTVGFHLVSAKETIPTSKETKTKEGATDDQHVSVTKALEAIVVSHVNLDFVKYISIWSFDSAFTLPAEAISLGNFLFSEKYFRTLFTHIISPNAP